MATRMAAASVRACAKVEVANTRCTALPSVWPVTQGMIGRTRWKTTRANCFLRRALVPTLCLKKFTCLSCTPEARNSPPACSQQTHAGISEGELVELRQQVIAPAAQHAAGAVRRPQARLPLLRGCDACCGHAAEAELQRLPDRCVMCPRIRLQQTRTARRTACSQDIQVIQEREQADKLSDAWRAEAAWSRARCCPSAKRAGASGSPRSQPSPWALSRQLPSLSHQQ